MIGKIESLWRFPVKSFQGEKLDRVELGSNSILGDRAFALLDKETGKVISAKSVKLFPDLLMCGASYVTPPVQGEELPPVQITLANGEITSSDSKDVNRVLSGFFGCEVELANTAPDDFTIDQYHPDLENVDPSGNRNVTTEQKLGSALFKSMGVDSPIPAGSFMDVFPLSVITTSSLEAMKELRPETNFDALRFRMNIVVKTDEPGFVENSWVEKSIKIGDEVSIFITMPDPRCVMTTLAQNGIPKDNHVLRTLVQHNRLDIMGSGKYPCAGVYASISSSGVVQVNDELKFV
jgi:uncharacterized protein YcbX